MHGRKTKNRFSRALGYNETRRVLCIIFALRHGYRGCERTINRRLELLANPRRTTCRVDGQGVNESIIVERMKIDAGENFQRLSIISAIKCHYSRGI